MTDESNAKNNRTETSTTNQDFFQTIVENVKHYAIFAIDPNGQILSWNPGVEIVLGYAQDDWVGKPISIIFTPEDIAAGIPFEETEIADRAGKGEDQRWHVRRNGSRFWANGLVTPLRNERGETSGFVKILRDDTRRKIAEERLRESEERYRTLFDSIDAGFCVCEMLFDRSGKPNDYRFLEVNPMFEQQTGLVAAAGKTVSELVPNLEPHWFEIYGKVAATGEPARFVNRSAAMNRWFEVYAFRVGEPAQCKIAILFNDITERKKLEIERDRFLAVGSDLQVINGTEGYFKWVNPAWEKAFGWTFEEMTTTPWRDFLHPEDYRATVAEAENSYTGAETLSFENRYRRKDGSYRWLNWRAKTFLEEKSVYAVATDITERKQAEFALLERERLATLNSEVNRALTEDKSLPEILNCCARILVKHLDAAFARIWTLDKTEKILELQASAGIYTHTDGAHSRVRVGEYKIGRIAATRQPHLTNQVVGDPLVSDQEWARREKVISFAGYPLVVGDRLVGVAAMFARQPLNETTLEALASVASSIALGIERKRGEQALRESEQRFRRMADDAPVMIWVTEPGGYCSFLSKSWYEFTGQKPENALGFGWLDATHPDDKERAEQIFVGANAARAPFHVEYRLRRSDGSYGWAIDSAVPRFDENKEFLGYIGSVVDITQRKLSEDAMRESDARLRLAIDISRTSTFEIDLLTDEVQTDAIGREIYGFAEDEKLTFNKIQSRFHPEDLDEVLRRVGAALAPETNSDEFEVEQRIIRTNGETRWIRVRGRAFFAGADDERRAVRCIGTYIDITANKVVEERLRAASEFNQDVLDSIAAHIAVLDEKGVITAVNRAWREFAVENGADWTMEGVGVGTNYLAVCGAASAENGDEANAIRDGIAAVLNKTQPFFSIEYPCHSPTQERWFLLGVSPLTRAGGGAVVSHTNITKRKQAELGLRESEEKFRNLADNISQLAWMTDAEGWIFWYNRRWFEYTGTTLEEMQGWGWQSVHDAAEIDRVVAKFKESLETGEPWEDTFPLRSASGEYRWFLSRAQPIRDRSGNIVRWFGTNTDIEELRQARRQAEEANRLKDEFLAIVSHELRSPLNSILGWNTLLRNQPTPDMLERVTEIVERQGKQQLQLIEDLLDTGRIVSGKMKIEQQPVDLAHVVTVALDVVRPAAQSKGIRLAMTLGSDAAVVTGDSERLQQVVWNLLSNAVKFTPRDGRVEIELRREDSNSLIVVSDTGKGIEPEFLPFVFDRFRQADSSTTRRFGGLGLGLSLVKQLVELHGGTVAVSSAGEDRGATFTVRLPVRAVGAAKAPVNETQKFETSGNSVYETDAVLPNNNKDAAENGAGGLLAGARILVADDMPDARALIAVALEAHGASVTTFASGGEALAALGDAEVDRQFDVFVCDIGMPDEDGYQIIKKLRRLEEERGGNLPAIALTAFVNPQDRLRALDAGFQMHVAKPVQPEQLAQVVASLLTVKSYV